MQPTTAGSALEQFPGYRPGSVPQYAEVDFLDELELIWGERAGYRLWVARSPGPLYDCHPEMPGWMHADMWVTQGDDRLTLIDPPWWRRRDDPYLRSIGYRLLEIPREEQERLWPAT